MSIKLLLKRHREALRTGKKTITFTIDEIDMLVNEITELLRIYGETHANRKNDTENDDVLEILIDSGKW